MIVLQDFGGALPATPGNAGAASNSPPEEPLATPATRELQAAPPKFWTFSCVCFQSPEGRKQNSPGLQPWERDAQRSRPERASELELAGNEEYVVIIFDGPISFAPNCARSLPREMASSCFRKLSSLAITPNSRPPLQGDSLSVRLPRAEALGCSLLTLRAVESASETMSKLEWELPGSTPPAVPLQRSLAKY
jgi:hypothetical protein